jgi:hypothetical protein
MNVRLGLDAISASADMNLREEGYKRACQRALLPSTK